MARKPKKKKPKKKKNLSREPDWVDVGSTKKNILEMSAVYARFGCREVAVRTPGASAGNTVDEWDTVDESVTWDVSGLSSDQLLALWKALGLEPVNENVGVRR